LTSPTLVPLFQETVYGITFEVIRGDICLETNPEKGAIVNAANNQLTSNNGLAGSIYLKGGSVIQEESKVYVEQNGELRAGDVMYTRGGNLKVKYVIHAVPPVFTGGTTEEEKRLEKCVKGSLNKALELGVESIAFPSLASGIYGFPKHLGAELTIRACLDFAREIKGLGSLKRIKFINTDQDTAKTYKDEFQKQLSLMKTDHADGHDDSGVSSSNASHQETRDALGEKSPMTPVQPGTLHMQNSNIDLTVSQFVEIKKPEDSGRGHEQLAVIAE